MMNGSPPQEAEVKSESKEVPHNVVIQRANDLIATMLEDPFLTDLSQDCTVESVRAQLALAQGRAITIHIRRFGGDTVGRSTTLFG